MSYSWNEEICPPHIFEQLNLMFHTLIAALFGYNNEHFVLTKLQITTLLTVVSATTEAVRKAGIIASLL